MYIICKAGEMKRKNSYYLQSKIEYIFISVSDYLVLKLFCYFITDLPIWNYDGSSTYQSQGENSDTFLYPVAIFNDPFRLAPNKLVMCEAYKHDHTPTGKNIVPNISSLLMHWI